MLIARTVAKRCVSRGLSYSDQHQTGCGSTQIKQVRLEKGDDAVAAFRVILYHFQMLI
jgi:hypothetical protein